MNKKILILGIGIISIASIVFMSSGLSKVRNIKNNNTPKEEKFLTDEEMEDINKKVIESINKNTKYEFAKIINVNDTKIDIAYLNTPKGYSDRGYNKNLSVDINLLKENGKKDTIDLIGADSNMRFEEIKKDVYIRIGIYEPVEKNDIDIQKGKILSIDKIN
ncbi:hypothetical protein [Paraclostridium dentum]|uniref:hypothetical protein n=1 Tax=Paraclostridium dentum TaxID=2662455 RepID=UPI003AFFAD3A